MESETFTIETQDARADAALMALGVLVVTMHDAGVIDATSYLGRLEGMATGAANDGFATTALRLHDHMRRVARRVGGVPPPRH